MPKVLIIGANSRIARFAETMLLENNDIQLTLFSCHPEQLKVELPTTQVIQGDATSPADVDKAVAGMDIVYASLAGNVIGAAKTIVKAMDDEGVKRLIWTSSLGIYNEIPGEFGRWNQQIMRDYYHRYRLAADVVEDSDVDYTIIRPAWLTNEDEIDYEITHRDDPFKGTEVSRKSVAAFVVKLIAEPSFAVRDSIGVDKPGTDGDRPRPAIMAANGGYEPKIKENIKLRFN